jgi:uncharacterized protein
MNEISRKSLAADTARVSVRVVDCDIHVNPRTGMDLADSLPEPWVSKGYRELLFAGGTLGTSVIFAQPNEDRRLDAFTPSGPPGSDPAVTGRQLFDEAKVDVAIIIPLMDKNLANPEHEAAMAGAMNTWLANTWLGPYKELS